ncbi:MAG: EF-hand domain-containing protein [Hyphomonadaceae bacterium]
MNISQASGSSAAWMLQRLFQSSEDTTTISTAQSAGRQKLPGADGQSCNTSGASSAPKVSGQTMSAMVSMQMGTPPSASDVASDLVSGLDTNGDGEVSADEITAAFTAAGLDSTNVASALSAIDTDSSGTLDAEELTTAISSDTQSHGPKGPKGPPPGGLPPGGSADGAASDVLSLFDENEDSSLSMDEILRALDRDSDKDGSVSSAFSSLDSDGDGQINLAELTSAIQTNINAGYRAYAESASLTG